MNKYMSDKENKQNEKFNSFLHDLKTPLTSILGYVDLLKSEDRNYETTREFLGIIEFEAEKLLQMIGKGINTNLKCWSESKNKSNCQKTISSICRSLVPVAEKKKVSISYDCTPDLFVDLEETKLWRVVSNLVENAIKYNNVGGFVKVDSFLEDENVVIVCEDNGIGIRSENLSNVFKRKFRENDNVPGFGFGLSTVKDIVSNNGGTITLKSEVGKGTSITVKLRKVI